MKRNNFKLPFCTNSVIYQKRYLLLVLSLIFLVFFSFGYAFLLQIQAAVSTDYLGNVTFEPGNFTHLNITTGAPYNNLIAYYSFDNDHYNLSAYDFGPINYDGAYGNVSYSDTSGCIYGGCLKVNGVRNSSVKTGMLGNVFLVNRTISAWFKPNIEIASRLGSIVGVITASGVGQSMNVYFQYSSNLTICRYLNGGGVIVSDTNYTIPADQVNQWHHVVCNWETNDTVANAGRQVNSSIFIDGDMKTNYIDVKGMGEGYSTGNIFIGNVKPTGAGADINIFNGSIDEVMLFNNTVLTNQQVVDIYNNQSSRFAVTGTESSTGNINITSGFNRINISINSIQNLFGSNISLGLGYYNATDWVNTASQNVSTELFNYTYTIDTSTANITLNWTFFPSPYNFYTPILGNITGNVTVNYYLDDGQAPNISLNLPSDGLNLTIQNIQFNFTALDNFDLGMNCSLVLDSVIINQNITVQNNTLTNLNASNVAQGLHFWNITCLDTNLNTNVSPTRRFSVDFTNPNATLINPLNNTYANNTSQNLTVNISDNYGIRNATLFIYNSTNDLINSTLVTFAGNTVSTIIGTVVNLVDGVYKWFYTIFDWSGNSFSTDNRTLTIDTIIPGIAFVSPTLATGSNASQTFIFANVSVTETNFANITFSLFNLTGNVNSTTFSTLTTSINWTNLSEGSYSYNVTLVDLASNRNVTETRTLLLDTAAPNLTNIVYSPGDFDSIDPRINITFNATIADNGVGIDEVLLEVYNGTLWQNFTMYKVGSTNVYQTNITLVPSDRNYTYFIFANDSLGHRNITTNGTFTSYWDCSFNITPTSLGTTGGFFQRKTLGNISLINSGDIEHSNNNCTVQFSNFNSYLNLSTDYWSQATWPGDGTRGLDFEFNGSIVTILNVSAKSNKTLEVFGKFPLTVSVLEEFPYFNTLSNIKNTITNTTNETITAKMIVTAGAYLETAIENTPQTIYLTPGNTTLSGYVKNVVDASSNPQNNTAYNVTFNWTLPSAISTRLGSGNVNKTYPSLINTTKQSNNLVFQLNSSNLVDMSQSVLTLSVYAQGYENSTENFSLIRTAANLTVFTGSQNISLLCYNVTDSICVTSCGHSLDPDCAVATTDSSSSSSSGSGGGSGGGGASQLVSSKAEYEFTRGKTSNIVVVYENKNTGESLTDLQFTLRGALAKYMEIVPPSLLSLGPKEKVNLKIIVNSPGFVPLGVQQIELLISGKLGTQNYNEQKIIILNVNELPKDEASDLLKQSEDLISKFKASNFSSAELDKLLEESKTALKELEYSKVKQNYDAIKKQVDSALTAKKIISELEDLIALAKEKGIDVSGSERITKLAVLALERNDFERALARAKEAQVTYALEVKGEIAKLSYYLKNNQKEISIAVLFLILFTYGSYKMTRLQLIKSKIRRLKKDDDILQQLMKTVQREAFQEKKMSMEEYKDSVTYYEKRIANVIEKLIELESMRVQAFSFGSKEKRLKSEKVNIIDLIKELQTDYLKRGKMETRAYELKLDSYNKRLGEIDSDLATLEAKKAFRGINGWKFFSQIPKLWKQKI